MNFIKIFERGVAQYAFLNVAHIVSVMPMQSNSGQHFTRIFTLAVDCEDEGLSFDTDESVSVIMEKIDEAQYQTKENLK